MWRHRLSYKSSPGSKPYFFTLTEIMYSSRFWFLQVPTATLSGYLGIYTSCAAISFSAIVRSDFAHSSDNFQNGYGAVFFSLIKWLLHNLSIFLSRDWIDGP